jgi:uncharacterized damage-inducible protein DinB
MDLSAHRTLFARKESPMYPPAEALLREVEAESAATRRLLSRVPADQLKWRPHPKSLTLGELALHVAQIPGALSRMLSAEGIDVGTSYGWKMPETVEELAAVHAQSLSAARDWLAGLDETSAAATWRVTRGDAELYAAPRIAFVRSLMFNHLYHHRGQLTVYLRLLDVPVPVVYGSSADESMAG